MSKESEPLDQRITIALIRRSEQFERAVVTGQDFLAAVARTGLVQALRRFVPNAFSRLSLPSPESQRFRFRVSPPEPPHRNPDPAYLEIVCDSTRRFKESMSYGNSASALEALV